MNPCLNIQDIWAATDEKSIHKMQKQRKKGKNKIFTHVITSSEESSPSDSDSSSEDSFVALRQEFRPTSVVRKSPAIQRRHAEQVALNQNIPVLVSKDKPSNDQVPPDADFFKLSNDQISPSAYSLPVKYETFSKTFLFNAKENKTPKVDETDNIQQYSRTNDEIASENVAAFVEVMNNGSITDRQCINNTLQGSDENLVIPSNSKNSSCSRAPNTSTFKKKANFQCITISEDVKYTKTIEIDFAQLSATRNTKAEDKNDVPKFQRKIKSTKKHPRNSNIKNEICTNYKKSSITLSQNNLPDLLTNEPVKWNSALEINSTNQKGHLIATKVDGVKFKRNGNDKIEWNIIQEEITPTLVTKSSNKNNTTRQLMYNNKIKDTNYSKKCFMEPSISKYKSRQVKFNNREINIHSKENPNTFLKQNKEQITWETTYQPNNNFKESEDSVNNNFNKKIQFHTDFRDKKDDHSKNGKTCRGAVNQQTSGIDKDSKETEYNDCKEQPQKKHQYLISATENLNHKQAQNLIDLGQKNPLIEYGKEVSDLIVGSHTAMSTFFSFYEEWKLSRCELIRQFELLDMNIIETSKQCKKYQDIFKVINGIAMTTAQIPVPHIAKFSRIVAFFSSLASQFFNKSNDKKFNMDVPEIITSLFRDIDASSDLYMYGLQCNQQLEETTKLIEKFHTSAVNHEFDNVCPDRAILTFIQSILGYNPKHHTFYKKLHKCFQELLQKESAFSKLFCEPFQFGSSDSIDIIGYLDWRFVNINHESVKNELEQINFLIQNNNTAMTELALRMKNCIRILKEELKSAERCVSRVSLFQSSFETLKLDSN